MQFVIEYVFAGDRRGYNFTSPTRGVPDDVLRRIWRHALPRGQGWGAPQYTGAVSLKCFPLDAGRVALSTVTVTDQADESGRRGIRRAVIDVLTVQACRLQLEARLSGYPADVQGWLESKPGFWQWHKIADRARIEADKTAALVVTHPYTDVGSWQRVEALLIKIATAPRLIRKLDGQLLPFTTLALTHHDESALVALPAGLTITPGAPTLTFT